MYNIPGNERENYFLKFSRITMLMLGIWPVRRGGDLLEKLYESYFLTTFLYYIAFNLSGLALAIITWSNNYLTTASSMGIVIEYMSNAYKVLLFKSSIFKSLIKEIQDRERDIFEGSDEAFKEIYIRNAESNKKVVLFYTIMGTSGISLYFITPLVSNVLMPLGYNNVTGVHDHYFIVFNWFPFDPNRYYWAAYLIQFTGCLPKFNSRIGYSYIVHCGAFYISILNFIRTQLKILRHVIVNMSEYSFLYKTTYNLTEEQSQFVLLKAIVLEHQTIISFVKRTNYTIQLFTLINFVISSFQLALLVYQIFQVAILQQITVLSYFVTLSTQLLLTYYAAHMIVFESSNIASSIFEGNWDTYPPQTLKILQMICMRAQKPLAMTIGPMAEVKVTALFQIFKALYSYICLIIKF